MQARGVQALQDELASVRVRLQRLQDRQWAVLTQETPDGAMLDRLERAIAPLAATEQKLLDERSVLEARAGGERWGDSA